MTKIPTFTCRAGCHDCCGPTDKLPDAEARRIIKEAANG